MKKEFIKSEKRIYAVVLILAVAAFILLNVFFGKLSDRYSLRFDTTADKLYSLSDTTEEVCKLLSDDTSIYVISSEDDYPIMFREILKSYTELSEHIKVEYIDPYTNPVFLEEMQQNGIALDETDLLVSGTCGNRKIGYTDMLVYSGENVTGISAEQQITSAISYVNTAVHEKVVFTTGHNERPSSSLVTVLENNNYSVDTLAVDSIDAADTDMIVIASPTRDFTEDEVKVVSDFLDNGGKVMAFFEPGSNDEENLFALLSKWNIKLDDNVVMDSKYSISGNPLNVMPVYMTHEINTFFSDNQYFMVMPSCRSITVEETSSDVSTLPLLISSASAYAKAGSQFNSTEKTDADESGTFKLAVISEKEVLSDDSDNKSGCLVVVGSRYVYGDDLMTTSSYANSDFFAQASKYMLKSSSAINIPAKSAESDPLVISTVQTGVYTILYVILIPAVILVCGAVVFVRRRKL